MKNILLVILAFVSINLMGQSSYVQMIEHTDLKGFFSDDLEAKAQELSSLISTSDPAHPFKVLSYNLMPSLAYADKMSFDNSLAYVDAQLESEPYYLAIIKTIETDEDSSTSFVKMKVKFKLPDNENYSDISNVVLDGMKAKFDRIANQKFEAKSSTIIGELEVFTTFINYLTGEAMKNEEALEELGFEKIELPPGLSYSVTNEESINELGQLRVENRIGLVVNNEDFADLLVNSFQADGLDGTDNIYFLFSSPHSLSTKTESDYVFNQFKSNNFKLKYWIHLDFIPLPAVRGDDNGSSRMVTQEYAWLKVDNNYTLQESEEGLDELFETCYIDNTTFDVDNDPFPGPEGCSLSWRLGKNCVYGPIQSLFGNSSVPFVTEQAAFYGGILDGGLGLIKFLTAVGKAGSSKSWYQKVVNTIGELVPVYLPGGLIIPVSPHYFVKVQQMALNLSDIGNSLSKIELRDILVAYQKFTIEMTLALDDLIENFDLEKSINYFLKFKDDVVVWLGKDFNGSASDAISYFQGLVAFEILLAYSTLGASALTIVSRIGIKGSQVIGKISSKLSNGLKSIKGFIDDFAKNSEGAKNTIAYVGCVLKGGCFVKDTPVLLANNPFKNVVTGMALAAMPIVAPIQDVQVDDMVKAYHHEDMYLTASNDADDIYVPGWQDYDYLDITPETWQVGKFIIEEGDGNLVEVEVNRPKKWFEEKEIEKVGDETYLYMPDVNIIGDAKLIEFSSTDIDTRVLELNENGQVDRPVISTFKRFSPIVYDYSFSDGGKIGATSEHPFFSIDRQTYVPVGELEEGEIVKSSSDIEVRFIGGKLRDKGESVYNFEVWREHNYYVGSKESKEFLLVHNTYWGGTFKYAGKGIQKAIDHIWDLHSFANKKPGKSYFASQYSTKGKVKQLVQDAIARGRKDMVDRGDGTFVIVVEMAEAIGKNQANNSTKWMTVILEGTRVRNSFPGTI